MNASTTKNISSKYQWSNNVSQFQCIKWTDARQPQTNHNQHGVKPVALGELQASSADDERRPVSKAVADGIRWKKELMEVRK